jgi:diacylglycerol kinase (ATP)
MKQFSIAERIKSFRFAFAGIRAFFKTQHNALIHLFATVLVFVAALFCNLSLNEWVALLIVTGFVWVSEIFNTAIEAMMDHLSPGQHPKVKFIKDVAAAAVLVAAVTAVAVGCFIFIPKLF